MRFATDNYMLEIDEDGISAVCKVTGESSDITSTNGVADLLGFAVDSGGRPSYFIDPRSVAITLSDLATIEKLHELLGRSRAEHSWRSE